MERYMKILSRILDVAGETHAQLLCRCEALSNSQWKTIGSTKAVGRGEAATVLQPGGLEQADHSPQINTNPV